MLHFDASQEAVLTLDHHKHARILGAPGTGKTTLIAETYANLLGKTGWSENDLLVFTPTRRLSAQLRQRVEQRVGQAIGGTPVRTPASYGFSVVQRQAALRAVPAPKLLTGTAHDFVIGEVLSERMAAGQLSEFIGRFSPEVVRGDVFRSEIRDFSRVFDDYAQPVSELVALLDQIPGNSSAAAVVPNQEQRALWLAALDVCVGVNQRLLETKPDEWSASKILAYASQLLRTDTEIQVPRLVLVDDAQELGEGALALLAALAHRGTHVWVFGDPDVATAAFQGERTSVLSQLHAEFYRRGVPIEGSEQTVILEVVHRHGVALRGLAQQLSARIGTAGAGAQRSATSAQTPQVVDRTVSVIEHDADANANANENAVLGARSGDSRGSARVAPIEFSVAASSTEQYGAIAHRLRRRHLGLDGKPPQAWSRMAVICRTRTEVTRAARVLAAQQVPTNIAAGGIVLREHQLVRELISLLQISTGIRELQVSEIWELLRGVVGGVDPIALRRFRAEVRLREQRLAREENREASTVDEVVSQAFFHPGDAPLIDARSGRQLRKLALATLRAQRAHTEGGTPREVLWHIWDGIGRAETLQSVALDTSGSASDEAHQMLDAAMGLFFALQRHEENDSQQPIEDLLGELLSSTLAQDSLAARSELECVTVTTPQGSVGMQFDTVCVLGPQDGNWPNLRARGSLLQVTAAERWLRGQQPGQPSRKDTLHDELRLFLQSCSRAVSELLVVAVADEDNHPSPFFGFGREFLREHPLPSNRLTLRGAVAEMRRRLVNNPHDPIALNSLVSLALAKIDGAHPQDWYGVQPISSLQPLVDFIAEPNALVPVSPSRMETAERCPLDWAISQLGGAPAGAVQKLGTLLHFAFERGESLATAEKIFALVAGQWDQLNFDAEWLSERYLATTREMSAGIADYLAEFKQSSRKLLGTEVPLALQIGQALLKGTADRLEAVFRADGTTELSVVDLKTGSSFPSANDIHSHAQLQAYQLGIIENGYQLEDFTLDETVSNGGARLLYVDPSLRTKRGSDAGSTFRIAAQPQLTAEARETFIERIAAAAQIMSAGTFTAQVEHHCSDPHALGGSCALHIIHSVSHA